MKKIIILLFFLCIIISFFQCLKSNENIEASAYHEEQNQIEIEVLNSENKSFYKLNLLESENSKIRNEYIKIYGLKNTIKNLENMGFSEEEISNYICPQIKEIYKKINNEIFKQEIADELEIVKNSCKIKIINGEDGVYVNKYLFYKSFLDQIKAEKKNIKINTYKEKYNNENIREKDFLKRSEFSTNFFSSSEERKNNIKIALERFDGIILNEGEILSFNKTTGERNEKTGYLPAKIISGGTFVEGFGGGVCQVSTTLYNACILAGLDIIEVHNHSLPVSYVEPSFDAMVNQGSSDLIIKNNTGGKIVITTSSKNDVCKVVIFGQINDYKIERVSKKLRTIEAEKESFIETDLKKYGIENLNDGEEKIISYPKDGFESEGYLNFYDKKGNLIKTKKIRNSKYMPTKGVIVKKEYEKIV